MADFCKQCSIEMFGKDMCEMRHTEDYPKPRYCEGCGFYCVVEPDGTCISHDCLKKHGKRDEKQDDITWQEQQIAQLYDGYDAP